jgi:hypothetical protein
MSKQYDPEDPVEIDKWTRARYNITDEGTEDFLRRNGFFADSPRGLAKRLHMAYAWILPRATEQTKPLINEIKTILEDFERKTSIIHLPITASEQSFVLPGQLGRVTLPPPLTDTDRLQLEKGQVLFEQAKSLLRLQPAVDAQEKYKKAQSERASKPRKLDDQKHQRIAKAYWALMDGGRAIRGGVKELAGRYEISPEMVRKIAKKYPPN